MVEAGSSAASLPAPIATLRAVARTIGVVLAALGSLQNFRWAAVAGLVTFVAPWLFGFSGVSAAWWTCRAIGGVIAIADGYQGFFKEPETRKTRPT